MGLNFIPQAASHAASGAALNLNLKDEHPSEDQIKDMQRGMLMDATLQAILRGNARIGMDGDCGQMEVIIPRSKQSGLSDADYQSMFPGVIIVHDRDLMPQQPLKGRLKGCIRSGSGRSSTQLQISWSSEQAIVGAPMLGRPAYWLQSQSRCWRKLVVGRTSSSTALWPRRSATPQPLEW
jgi:hypothetical protein